MIKERPILMSAPMVRAILEGRKTQTRRIIKPQPYFDAQNNLIFGKWNYGQDLYGTHVLPKRNLALKCPYGNLGDRLWVRESYKRWCIDETGTVEDGWWSVRYRSDNNIQKHCATWDCCVTYDSPSEAGCDKEPDRWEPSIHMPRWASRILLEIIGIRIERLQDITEDEAIAEGVLFNGNYDLWWDYQREQWSCVDPIDSYKSLICKINGPETWEKNPWVWVVDFEVIEVKGGSHD